MEISIHQNIYEHDLTIPNEIQISIKWYPAIQNRKLSIYRLNTFHFPAVAVRSQMLFDFALLIYSEHSNLKKIIPFCARFLLWKILDGAP